MKSIVLSGAAILRESEGPFLFDNGEQELELHFDSAIKRGEVAAGGKTISLQGSFSINPADITSAPKAYDWGAQNGPDEPMREYSLLLQRVDQWHIAAIYTVRVESPRG